MSTITLTDTALIRLMHLVSPALPIGMYSYSQGLEKAIDDQWVKDEATVQSWLQGQLQQSLAYTDVPILARLYDAWSRNAAKDSAYWSQELLANRETAELRAEDRQAGRALARVLNGLGIKAAASWEQHPQVTLALCFTLAAKTWSITREATVLGYLWAWLENQVLAAVKLVPLGQSAGQRLLQELSALLPSVLATGLSLEDNDIGGCTLGVVLASSRHEVQYSRLFRS